MGIPGAAAGRRVGATPAVVVAVAVLAACFAVVRPQAGHAAPNQFVTLGDGVSIALNVRMPDDYVPGRRYPTVFEMSGYDGGSAQGGTLARDVAAATGVGQLPLQEDSRSLTRMFNDRYVTVHASIRGTGCSGGEFDLFSRRSALDGREIIDEWIARQPWSNGDVAIMGHSYGGITGFMVATTQPRHLRAVTVSGVVDDLYRGLTHPGGVRNVGFPVAWAVAVRPAVDVLAGFLPGVVRPEGAAAAVGGRRRQCLENGAAKRRTVADEPAFHGLSDTDSEWFRARSPITYVDGVAVPVHVVGTHQDESTGPRGAAHLWEKVRGVPKRLLLSNGDHAGNVGPQVMDDRRRWVDHWLLGVDGGHGTLAERRTSVTTLFETRAGVANGVKESRTFPLEDTAWTDWFLDDGGRLTTGRPAGGEGGDSYVAAPLAHAAPAGGWPPPAPAPAPGGPPLLAGAAAHEVRYRSAPLSRDTAVAGPVTATLFARAGAPDTAVFVRLVDEAPDGSRMELQHGLLRAAHRAVLPERSDRTPDGRIYRPFRPHDRAVPLAPGRVEELLVEVFPVGHVFRAGHRVVVVVSAPPAVDRLAAYAPTVPPSPVTLLHGTTHPSRLTLPLVPLDDVALGPPPACGEQDALRCVRG